MREQTELRRKANIKGCKDFQFSVTAPPNMPLGPEEFKAIVQSQEHLVALEKAEGNDVYFLPLEISEDGCAVRSLAWSVPKSYGKEIPEPPELPSIIYGSEPPDDYKSLDSEEPEQDPYLQTK